MGEAGAGQDEMRGIGMVDRRHQPPRFQLGGEIDLAGNAERIDRLRQRPAALDRLQRQRADIGDAGDEPGPVLPRRDHPPGAVLVPMLQQSQCHVLSLSTAAGGDN